MEPQGKVQKAPIELIYDGFQGAEGLVAAVAKRSFAADHSGW